MTCDPDNGIAPEQGGMPRGFRMFSLRTQKDIFEMPE